MTLGSCARELGIGDSLVFGRFGREALPIQAVQTESTGASWWAAHEAQAFRTPLALRLLERTDRPNIGA